jgi:hypothetical protein
MTLSAFLVAVALAGRFPIGFDGALGAAAAAGIALALLARRLPPGSALRRPPRSVELRLWAVVGAIALVYTRIAFTFDMHDELLIAGHQSFVAQLARGAYPPYFAPFPEHLGRYHFGFDVLAGALSRASSLPPHTSIDVLTVLMAVFISLAAAAIADEAGARRSIPFAVIAVHFGAGLAVIAYALRGGTVPCMVQVIDLESRACVDLIPTQLSNVFQHPVSLGLPLFLLFALLLPRLLAPRPSPMLVPIAGVLLAALSFAQVAYFGLAVLAAIASAFLLVPRSEPMRWLVLCTSLGLGIALGRAMGGMLIESALIQPNLIGLGPHAHGLAKLLFESLGLGLLLLPIYVWTALKGRAPITVFMVLFALGGIAAVSLFHYRASGDMRKFPAASAYALSLLYVLVVDRALIERSIAWRTINALGRVLSILGGIATAVVLILPVPRALDPYPSVRGAHAIEAPIADCARWLIARGYDRRDLIYTAAEDVTDVARSGLSVVGEDWGIRTYGVRRAVFDRQKELSDRVGSTMSKDALVALGVRWILLSDEERDRLPPEAIAALPTPAVSCPSPERGRTRHLWSVPLR